MRNLRSFNCADCGAPTRRRRDPNQPRVCAECGIQRGVIETTALHNREPHALKRWADGMARAAMAAWAEAEGTPAPALDKPKRHSTTVPGMRAHARSTRERKRVYGK